MVLPARTRPILDKKRANLSENKNDVYIFILGVPIDRQPLRHKAMVPSVFPRERQEDLEVF
jgi:hypothetical protein